MKKIQFLYLHAFVEYLTIFSFFLLNTMNLSLKTFAAKTPKFCLISRQSYYCEEPHETRTAKIKWEIVIVFKTIIF